jgi:hypothetical protein
MKLSEDEEAKRSTRTGKPSHTANPPSGDSNEQGILIDSGKSPAAISNLKEDCVTDSEEARLKWELEKHLENFRFFLDLGLKAVGLFYAILGGILSIYFAKAADKNAEVMKVLLWVPFLISVILGVIFLIGARLMRDATIKLNDISRNLRMRKPPDFSLLTWLLVVFGASFLVTGASLVWLYYRLT